MHCFPLVRDGILEISGNPSPADNARGKSDGVSSRMPILSGVDHDRFRFAVLIFERPAAVTGVSSHFQARIVPESL